MTQGTVLTLQAVVDAGGAVTAGAVTFSDGTRVLASVQLVSTGSSFTHGTANLKLFLGPGSHVLKAVYGGTHGYVKSTSPTQTITVTGILVGRNHHDIRLQWQRRKLHAERNRNCLECNCADRKCFFPGPDERERVAGFCRT